MKPGKLLSASFAAGTSLGFAAPALDRYLGQQVQGVMLPSGGVEWWLGRYRCLNL
jgi:hypothetical protein